MRAIISRTSTGVRLSLGIKPRRSSTSCAGGSGSCTSAGASSRYRCSQAHCEPYEGLRFHLQHSGQQLQIQRYAPLHPLILPAVTSSPVAALTSGGPARKMVPLPLTMMDSSLIAGTYAPPAVHEPRTAATCGMPSPDIRAWLRKMRPK